MRDPRAIARLREAGHAYRLLTAGVRLTRPAWVRRFLRLALGDPPAQVAELVDALVSGTSGAIRGGSSPLLGTNNFFIINTIELPERCRAYGFSATIVPFFSK